VRDELPHTSTEQVGKNCRKAALRRPDFFLFLSLSHRPRTTQVFKICKAIVDDYKNYLNSFTNVMDSRIHEKVQEAFETGAYLPAPFSLLHPHSIFRIKAV
jgi:hypothetical protein